MLLIKYLGAKYKKNSFVILHVIIIIMDYNNILIKKVFHLLWQRHLTNKFQNSEQQIQINETFCSNHSSFSDVKIKVV